MFEHPFSIDFCWQSAKKFDCPSTEVAALLFDQGSLTSLLKAQCEHFRVKLLSEKWLTTSPSHAEVFESERQRVLCREVLLYCDDIATVYAQSWITEAAYQSEVGDLGETPLGEVLFSDNSWVRSALEVCNFDSQHTFISSLIRDYGQAQQSLYARRRTFTKHHAQVMVCEVFLPGETDAAQCT
ncbi:chorismate--pyruvate lyase family protein [Pseudoalteromonas citrea]|uniref:chorismate--pyruvate lyase family protein n=1 Tax=Pseudoalteromonas citrea TaxID=43655 RepID=UPI00138AFEF6|nr:chorismate lyase [Pseudoalteromonas citrea]